MSDVSVHESVSESSESEQSECATKKKKGIRQPEKYSHNIIKKAKVQGLGHVNHAKKEIPARQTGEDCGCRRHCFQSVSEDEKLNIISRFNSFGSKNEQDVYLQGLIKVDKPADVSRRLSDEKILLSKSNRRKLKTHSYRYFVEKQLNGPEIQTCKRDFISLHGISNKRVWRLASLKSKNLVASDLRRKSQGSRIIAIPGDVCAKIHQFMEMLPFNEAHYGNNLSKKYLSADYTVTLIHKMFLQKYPELEEEKKVKYKFFLKYFNENFDISFGQPQIDVCSRCEELGTKLKDPHLNNTAKRVAAAEMMVHKRRAKKFYSKMNEVKEKCKTDPSVLDICFDYMQNLPLPAMPVQEVFYYRQLWVNEFCVQDFKTGKAVFYSYHEGEAHKGPDEVCTFVNLFLEEHASDIKELHLFCDACPGQNRNNTMIRYLLALTMTGKFTKVKIYFPQRGHSFNDCDRNFALVKRKIRRHDRVYTPEEYEDFIISSSQTNKFSLKKIRSTDIVNFQQWWPSFFKRKVLSLKSMGKAVPKAQKEYFAINKFYEFECNSDRPGIVICRKFIDTTFGEQEFNLLKPKPHERIKIPDARTLPAYTSKIAINHKKMDDVKKLYQYIPDIHRHFYNDLFTWPTTTAEVVGEEVSL